MAYEYGSNGLGIKNPFRFEGFLKILRGLITFGFGMYLLSKVPAMVASDQILGWMTISFSSLILLISVSALGKGILQVVRFFVGRNAPTSLATDLSIANSEKEKTSYTSQTLEEMLLSKKNNTFVEPTGIIELILHSFIPKLTFAPIPIRNIAQVTTSALIKTFIALMSILISSFIIYSGIIKEHTDFIFNVFAFVMVLYVLSIWWKSGKPINRTNSQKVQSITATSFVKTMTLSVSIPVAISYFMTMDNEPAKIIRKFLKQVSYYSEKEKDVVYGFLNSIGENFQTYVIWSASIMFALILVSFFIIFTMTLLRTKGEYPETNTSEHRESWDKDVHPKEIFINLEQIVMAKRRYKDIPNRSYIKTGLRVEENGNGKGSYNGKLLQETQPILEKNQISKFHRITKTVGTLLGQLLLGGVVVSIYLAYLNIPEIVNFVNKIMNEKARNGLTYEDGMALGINFISILTFLTMSLVFLVFGRLLSNNFHVYWSELRFKSKLLYLNCEGTYNESRITMGKGIYDSAQSDNVIVKTSNTSICIASEIETSTFAGVGSTNLELPRHIMNMKDASVEMNAIIDELKSNLDNKKKIASIENEQDLKTMEAFSNVNREIANKPEEKPSLENNAKNIGYNNYSQNSYGSQDFTYNIGRKEN